VVVAEYGNAIGPFSSEEAGAYCRILKSRGFRAEATGLLDPLPGWRRQIGGATQ